MIRPWYRSRLFWIGIVLIPLLSAAWRASEFYPTVTILRQKHRHRELGHRFGSWSYVSVDRPSAFRRMMRTPSSTFNVGSTAVADWDELLDSIGFVPSGAEPLLSFEPSAEARYFPEEAVARTAYFPPTVWEKGDGWRFLFVPYWLLLPCLQAISATALWAWQKGKRMRRAQHPAPSEPLAG